MLKILKKMKIIRHMKKNSTYQIKYKKFILIYKI